MVFRGEQRGQGGDTNKNSVSSGVDGNLRCLFLCEKELSNSYVCNEESPHSDLSSFVDQISNLYFYCKDSSPIENSSPSAS